MHLPDNIRQKIEKLLALAESTNPHEAAAAMEKAQEILNRYNLSRDDVQPGQAKPDITHERIELFAHARGSKEWRYSLTHVLAQFNLCQALFSRHIAILIGRPQDIETVTWLYNHIAPRLYSMADVAVLEYRDWRKQEGYHGVPRGSQSYAAYRNNFLLGAVSGIARRLELMKETMANGTKVIVIYNREILAEYQAKAFPKLISMNSKRWLNTRAFDKGREAGENMTWGKPIEDKQSSQSLID